MQEYDYLSLLSCPDLNELILKYIYTRLIVSLSEKKKPESVHTQGVHYVCLKLKVIIHCKMFPFKMCNKMRCLFVFSMASKGFWGMSEAFSSSQGRLIPNRLIWWPKLSRFCQLFVSSERRTCKIIILIPFCHKNAIYQNVLVVLWYQNQI